jgi:hypothetical protein
MDDEKLSVRLAAALALLILYPLIVCYHGWALWLLWNWFAAPIAPPITWPAAVGLVLLIWFIKYNPAQKDTKPSKVIYQAIVVQVAVLFYVGIGWAFHAVGFGAQP